MVILSALVATLGNVTPLNTNRMCYGWLSNISFSEVTGCLQSKWQEDTIDSLNLTVEQQVCAMSKGKNSNQSWKGYKINTSDREEGIAVMIPVKQDMLHHH